MQRYFIFLFLILSLVFSCITAPSSSGTTDHDRTSAASPVLELDSSIIHGKLSNGLTYYIRKNAKPEQRAELRLVVNTGSVLEDDNQRGIAHFLEHLAFNGTLHFKKDSLIDYLESIGMRFGSDLNASTSYDETIYRLQVPTDDIAKLDTGLLILEDWAHNIVIDPVEVEKERKVIIEEWRSDRGADERIRDTHLADSFTGSRYAERRPIGEIKIIETVRPETIQKFYSDWYRPDLMAVVVVGDVDPEMVRKKIEQQFGSIPAVKNPRPRELFTIPGNDDPIISIAAEKEATSSWLKLFFKQTPQMVVTEADYRMLITRHLFFDMINSRLDELSQNSSSPFVSAYAARGRFVRTMDVGLLGAVVKENQVKKGLESLLIEVERIKKHGFVFTELERGKQNAITSMEQAYENSDKRDSSHLASEYIRNFLEKETVPGIEKEYKLYEKFIPGITLDEMNSLADTLLPVKNRILLVAAPQKPDIPAVTKDDCTQIFAAAAKADVQPYVDDTAAGQLMTVLPKPGTIIKTVAHDEMGITELTLSNGIHVLLKPTQFTNDEIVMRAFSPGGLSLVSDDVYVPASTAAGLVAASGVAGITQSQLGKLLAGKQVQVSPYIDELFEGFSGGARTKDIKEMFQLIYLYFTAPAIDNDAFLAYKDKLITSLAGRTASPETVFWDIVNSVLTNDHPRRQPWTPETAELLNSRQSLEVYKSRFQNAGDFTFVFAGDFDLETLTPFIETYLAGLPASGKAETYKDLGMYPPKGVTRREVKLGKDQKSIVQFVYHGDFTWTLPEIVALQAISQIVDMRLTDSIREDEGGTYGIGAWDYPRRFPRQTYMFFINFGCDPGRVEELTALVYEQIEKLKKDGITQEELATVKQILTKEREVTLTKNATWAELIKNYRLYNMPFTSITGFFDHINALDAKQLQDTARKYLSGTNRVEAVFYPAEK
ncbi:MAG: insulinase family protein [Spirochaetales bacterium]|nr:insulinase family protein [Spirochaetales bacterium]